MEEYLPKEIEQKWQKRWNDTKLFIMDPDSNKPKFYCLMMFPYPSAALHVGHGRNYIIGDVVARYKIMQGYNVLTPMGWDAFGLPAENAAIKSGIHPRISTLKNIQTMKRQFNSWGVGYAWDREVTACLPDYYKWTQWIFLQLFKKGLAYKKEGMVNWCPSCQTVLANEQVVEGECERCGETVIQKELEQWFLKITDYADRLLDDLELLKGWPEKVKIMQKNWIGKSIGAEIEFPVVDTDIKLKCFTTRLDTIYGATYAVLAPENPLVDELSKGTVQEKIVADFKKTVQRETRLERESTGVEKNGVFTGRYAVNPFTGEKIPLWTADYVLYDYGTGAVMAVPTHDQRDFLFAKKYNLPLRVVITPEDSKLDVNTMAEAYEGDGVLVNSGAFDGLHNREAIEKMADLLEQKGWGRRTINYKLRDWLVSRQRYWGAPIPIIYCDKCGIVPVPEKDLPVLLPDNVEFKPTGKSPLASCEEFVHVKCPKCNANARRELDTMDTFVDSSWYFLRYLSAKDDQKAFDKNLVNKWLPVDQYIGGVEHAILHLMYSRFLVKVLNDMGFINFKEPFQNLFTQGMITKNGIKMSKSRGNTVSSDDLIEKFGADTVRLYTLFIGPPEKDAEWSDQGVEGSWRFLNRVWRIVAKHLELIKVEKEKISKIPVEISPEAKKMRLLTHGSIKKVTEDIENGFHFNTAIASLMEFTNSVYLVDDKLSNENSSSRTVLAESLVALIRLISPFVPHMAEELWEKTGAKYSVFNEPWIKHNPVCLKKDTKNIVVQVDGKVRAKLEVASGMQQDELKNTILADERIKKFIAGKSVNNVIIVPDKLVNIVTG